MDIFSLPHRFRLAFVFIFFFLSLNLSHSFEIVAASGIESGWHSFWMHWRIPFFYLTFIPLVIVCLCGVGWREHFKNIKQGLYNEYLILVLFFFVLSCVWTLPLIFKSSDQMSGWGDSLYLAFVFDHHYQHLLGPWNNYFNLPVFAPSEIALARSEHMFSGFLLMLPVMLITKNSVLAINILTFLSYWLCPLAVYFLARNLKLNKGSALIAALLFGYCGYRYAHFARPQLIGCYFLPLCFLFFKQFAETKRPAYLWRFILVSNLQLLMGGYWFVFLLYSLGAWCLYEYARNRLWKDFKINLLLGAGMIWLLATVYPWMEPYFYFKKLYGTAWDVGHVIHQAARGSHFFCTTSHNWIWGELTHQHYNAPPGIQEGHLFPGLMAYLLGGLGLLTLVPVVVDLKNRLERFRLLILDTICVFALLVFSYPMLTNDFHLIFPFGINFNFPSLKVLFGLCALLFLARFSYAFFLIQKSEIPYQISYRWIICGLIILFCFMMMFGPGIDLGHHVWDNPFYKVAAQRLPGLGEIRGIARFYFIILLFGSLFAGLGWEYLSQFFTNKFAAKIALSFIALVLLIENASFPMRTWNYRPPELPATLSKSDLPEGYHWLNKNSIEEPVFMMPISDVFFEIYYMYTQKWHGQKMVNGYSGYMPPGYEDFRQQLNYFPDSVTLEAVQKLPAKRLILHRVFYNEDQWKKIEFFLSDPQKWKIKFRSKDIVVLEPLVNKSN